MTPAAEITRPARPASLADLLGFLDAAIAGAKLDATTAFDVRLAAEEVCTNVIAHAYPAGVPGPVTLRLERKPDVVVVTVEDAGIPFDPTTAPSPALGGDWHERAIGGLGWHLVRRVVDEVHHEPIAGGGNRVTLIKRLPAGT